MPCIRIISVFEGEEASDGEGQWQLVIGVGRADLEFLDIVDLHPVNQQLHGVLHAARTGDHDALRSHVDEEVSKSFVYFGLGVALEVLPRL